LRSALDKEAAYVLWDYGQDVIGTLPGLMKILETSGGLLHWRIPMCRQKCAKKSPVIISWMHLETQILSSRSENDIQPTWTQR